LEWSSLNEIFSLFDAIFAVVSAEYTGTKNIKATNVIIAIPITPKNLRVDALIEYTNIIYLLALCFVIFLFFNIQKYYIKEVKWF
jgi:amino acid transporter